MGKKVKKHLVPVVTDRGFTHLPGIPSDYGGEILAYESSAAEGAHLWVRMICPVDLNEPNGEQKETVAHLTAKNAKRLSEQLTYLVDNHYQTRES